MTFCSGRKTARAYWTTFVYHVRVACWLTGVVTDDPNGVVLAATRYRFFVSGPTSYEPSVRVLGAL